MEDRFKKVKTRMAIVWGSIVLVGAFLFNLLDQREAKKEFVQGVKSSHFSGTITGKFIEQCRTCGPVSGPLIILDSNSELKYGISNYKAFLMIDTGDYIIKQQGVFKHLLIKGTDTLVFYQGG